MSGNQPPSLIDRLSLGFTLSTFSADFLRSGEELWSAFANHEDPNSLINKVFPTGSVISTENGLTGIVTGSDGGELLFLIVPNPRNGSWFRASLPIERATVTILHSPNPEAQRNTLLQTAISAIIQSALVADESSEQRVAGLSPAQMELLFLLPDIHWIVSRLHLWCHRNESKYPFMDALMDKVVAPGLSSRIGRGQKPLEILPSLLLLSFASDSGNEELMRAYGSPRNEDRLAVRTKLLTALTDQALRELWTNLEIMEQIGGQMLGADEIRDAISALIQRRA